jgi:O-antigen ligase
MPLKSISRFFAQAPLFLIPFFALIVTNDLFFPFIVGKAFYFRILVEIAFAAWVILAFLDAKYRPRWNAITVGITAFALITLAADLLGVNPIRSLWSNFERMEGWIIVAHLWMFYMTAAHAFGSGEEGGKLWRAWINTSLFVAAIVGIYGFVQLLGWAPIHQSGTRVDASLGNAAYMAVYMLMSAGFAAYLFFDSRIRRAAKKLLDVSFLEGAYIVLAACFSFLVIETATRGTTFGLIGGILLALALFAAFGKGQSSKLRIAAAGIIVAIIALAGIIWLERGSSFVQNSPSLSRLTSITLNDIETQGRAYIWPMALKASIERPILGWGQENFNYIFNANYNPKMYNQEQWFDRAHSVYLDWLVASGFIGLVAYLALYVLLLIVLWKSRLSIMEKSALTGLLAGYAIHNIFVFDNLASYVLFFAFLGFVSSLKHAHAKSDQASKQGKEISHEIVEYVVAPLAIIALIFGVYFYNIRPLQENSRLITALQACGSSPDASLFTSALTPGAYVGLQEIREQILQCAAQVITAQQIPGPTKQAFYQLATEAIADQIKATPNDARIYTLGGSFYAQIGAYNQAVPLLEKAHSISETKQSISLILASVYVNTNQAAKAESLLKETYAAETADTEVRTALISVMIIDGHEADAKKQFGDDPSLFETEQAAQAYALAKQYDKAIAIYETVIGTSTDMVNTQFRLAQAEYAAGYIYQAVQTLKSIETAHPEYKTQMDEAIKQIQAGK